MRRRTFLQLSAGLAAAGAVRPWPAAGQGSGPFRHGVASGDPTASSAIIWTRVTPADDATPGSGLGAPTPVAWEVATDPDFAGVVADGATTAAAATDHTVKVDVGGLAPGTDHWYRFTALGSPSRTGRFRTAPAVGTGQPDLRFGVASCSQFQAGYFSSYRHLAARDDLDAVIHLGDYLYEGGNSSEPTKGPAIGRSVDPPFEMTTLEHYRRRHATYKADPDLQALHARHAFLTTIDDHEVANDAFGTGAGNHQPSEGDYLVRRAAAMQAYFEWMPIRPTGGPAEPHRIYRRVSYGDLADIFLLDVRTYRSRPAGGLRDSMLVLSPEPDEPGRTMLGADQLAFLEDGLRSSTARWRVIANGVMFAPFVVADLPDVLGDLVNPLLVELDLSTPLSLNGDQWDGYRAERSRLHRLFEEVGNVVILTGDIHSSWGAEIPSDPGAYLTGLDRTSVAVEFVTPAVTSDSLQAFLDDLLPGLSELAPLVPPAVELNDPWFRYVDLERQGYGVFGVDAGAAQYDWHYVSNRADPAATSAFAAARRTPSGSNRLHAAGPLGPRTAAPATALATAGTPGPAAAVAPPASPAATAPGAAPAAADPAAGAPATPVGAGRAAAVAARASGAAVPANLATTGVVSPLIGAAGAALAAVLARRAAASRSNPPS